MEATIPEPSAVGLVFCSISKRADGATIVGEEFAFFFNLSISGRINSLNDRAEMGNQILGFVGPARHSDRLRTVPRITNSVGRIRWLKVIRG